MRRAGSAFTSPLGGRRLARWLRVQGAMKPHRLAAVLFAALSVGCTYSSLDYGSDPDASAEQVARVSEDEMGGAYPHEELRMGTGRAADRPLSPADRSRLRSASLQGRQP